jgi:cellulose synthase/poly-beta-1,6-N-acetylglucosamine synthase-like glycosyltransferase
MSGLLTFLFWACAALLFYVFVGYPVLMAVLALLMGRRTRPEPNHSELPSISVLIAAYNEEKSIGRKIDQTLALDYPADKLQIVVVSDGSSDRTCSIVRSFNDPRVQLLEIHDRKGKTNAQNQAVKLCTGDIIVFSDATTVYHKQALWYLACNYADTRVGAVSGRYEYFDIEGGSPTGLGTIAFWNYENLIKVSQSRVSTICGCCGCIYSVRRSLYTNLKNDIISDLVQPLWILMQGYRVVFEDRALAYEETTRSTTEEFAMRVRVATRGMRGILSVPDLLKPWKHPWISFQLTSHKILRWLVPCFALTLFATSIGLAQNPIFKFFAALQAVFYAVAILSILLPLHRKWKPLGVPLYFCTINAAALVSLVQVFRGKKYVVWETVRSEGQ